MIVRRDKWPNKWKMGMIEVQALRALQAGCILLGVYRRSIHVYDLSVVDDAETHSMVLQEVYIVSNNEPCYY